MPPYGTNITADAWTTLTQHQALTSVVYTAVPAPVRNLETGQTTGAGTTYTVDMLLRGYRRDEMNDTAIVAGDLLARIPKANLAVTPNTRHTVTHDGVVWSIVAIADGANGGWWRLQLRRPRPV